MMKWLVLLLVVLGVWGGLTLARRGALPRAKSDERIEPMVACAHCGLHLPGNDALKDGDKAYCSAAHRDLGPATPQDPKA